MYVTQVVDKLIKKYKTTDPFLLCELLNIKLLITNLGNEVNGMYQHSNPVSIIHLNAELLYEESRVVLAHEIGHHVMHKGYNCAFLARHTYGTKQKYEHRANIFAAELLLPNKLDSECTELSVEQICMYYEIPQELLEFKKF